MGTRPLKERRIDWPVSRLMAVQLRTVSTEDTMEKVQAELNRWRLSAVPVVNADGSAFGIISAADLLHFNASKKNAKATRAWEACTYKPISVTPDTPISEVAKLMLGKRIHHVLVVEGSTLRGLVSTFDFMRHYMQSRRT